MTKRNISTLFAVAVLATGTPALANPDRPVSQQQVIKPRTLPSGRPACGNTMSKSKSSDADCTPPSTVTTARPAPPVQRPIELAPVARRILSLLGLTDLTVGTPAARPREFRNGRPANGNIPRRAASRPVETSTEEN